MRNGEKSAFSSSNSDDAFRLNGEMIHVELSGGSTCRLRVDMKGTKKRLRRTQLSLDLQRKSEDFTLRILFPPCRGAFRRL